MKSGIILWLIFFLLLMVFAYMWKVMAITTAEKVMKAKRWPLPDDSDFQVVAPLDSRVRKGIEPRYGADAIQAARSSVIIADFFMWCILLSFIIFSIFLAGGLN